MGGVLRRLWHFAEVQPEAPAFIDQRGSTSYGELRRRVQAMAGWLHERGVRSGDVVAVVLERNLDNALASLEQFYALAYLGAAVLPIYPDVPPANVARLVSRIPARMAIAVSPGRAVADLPLLDASTVDLAAPRWLERVPPPAKDDAGPFLYHFTSGTTGDSKIILFGAEQFLDWSLAPSNPFGFTPGDRLLPPGPWPSKAGLRDLFRVQIFGGALVNLAFPKTWQELAIRVDRHGVTCISGSPSQLRRLLGVERPPGMQPRRLRVLTLAGAPITPSEIETARRLVTPNVYVDYGSNEISMIALLRPEDPIGSRGNVGRMIPKIEVEAVDDENRPLPPGRVGLLRFRAPWMANSYVDNPADTAERFRGGWFYPGDRGSITADRTLTLEGRADDVINFASIKITPADVEPELLKHPNVADVVLVGVPDPGAGEVPVAFVVLRGKITGAELTVDWAQWIDGKEMPRRVVTMQEIPRNPEGKVLRNKLREIYLAADAAAKRS